MIRWLGPTLVPGLILFLPLASHGQGVVPGGWAPQFGYQVIAGPGAVGYGAGVSFGAGVPGAYGYAFPSYAGFSPYGTGLGMPGVPAVSAVSPLPYRVNYLPPADRAVNVMDPLIHSIRQATRTRRGR